MAINPQSDRNFIFQQNIPSDTWDVHHSLAKFPAITVIDSNGDEVEGDVQYVSNSHVILKFVGAFSGVAIFN